MKITDRKILRIALPIVFSNVTIPLLGLVDSAVVGSYTITYTATDSEDNTSTATRTVNVVDTTAPVFTSSGLFQVLEGVTNVGNVTVEQNTRATRHNPVSGDGRVTFSLVNVEASNGTAGANALSIDSSSALITFNFVVDYDSMYNPDDGKLDFLATVTATDASGNAANQQIVVTILNDPNDDVGYADGATATNGNTATGTGTGTNEN